MKSQSCHYQQLFPVITLCGLLTLSALPGCSKENQPRGQTAQNAEPQNVQLSSVEVRNLPVFIEASGSLLANETVTLSAKVSGRVEHVYSDLGDMVKPGQKLANIDATDYRLAIDEKRFAMDQALAQLGLSAMPEGEVDTTRLPMVQRAAAQERNASTRLERLSQLHAQKLVSDQDFNDAQTAAQIARSEYEVAVLSAQAILAEARTRQSQLATARQQLADTQITVPVVRPGDATRSHDTRYLVAQRLISEGEYVQSGTPLFRLVDDNPIRLRMAVPERYSAQVRLGQTVSVRVQAFKQPFEGEVTRISPEINEANRTFIVEAAIANPDHRLKAGGFAMGAIEITAEEPTLLVPKKATSTFAGVSKVFTVVEGKSREIIVKLGKEHGDMIEVTQGLKPDTQIINPLPARMVSGQPVVAQGAANASQTAKTEQATETARN